MSDASSSPADTPRKAILSRVSLRVRLTVWVLIIFAVIQLTLGAIVYLYQRASVDGFFEQRLESKARELRSELAARHELPTDNDLQRLAAAELDFFMFENLVLTVYGPKGGVIASSSRPAPEPPLVLFQEALEGPGLLLRRLEVRGVDAPTQAESLQRLAIGSFVGPGGSRCVLLLATGDRYAQGMMARVREVLVIAAPIGFIAAGVAGWCIAGIAVAPLRELRSLTTRLSPESIGRPMEPTARDPEFARLERDLESARARIAQALAAQERFMSNVSHELKTPISVVQMESQAIQMEKLPDHARKYVASVREEMQRLGRLVNSFLTLTRVREGRSQTVSKPVMINEMLLESIDHCRSMARQYNVMLRPVLLSDEADVDLAVRGDPDLLRTMLDNLVRNAIRFSPANAEVRVAAQRNGEAVYLTVRDRGSGIPEELLERIFDRFAQAKAEERRGRGHGLGLEIAQGVAELHGGRISVQNQPDGGCEFTVRLPIPQSRPV